MPHDFFPVCPSHPLTRAYPLNSFDTTPTSNLLPTATEPSQAVQATYGQFGSWDAGAGGMFAAQRLYLLPYCDGPEGSQFWLRLYGWRTIGTGSARVWIPTLLIQLVCIAGNLPGPPSPPAIAGLALAPTENLCDTLGVVVGSVGPSGEIVSVGPGSQFAAFALVELRGCRKYQFEFQAPEDNVVGMNALWALA